LASGILPVALGLATPLIAYAMNFSKTYTFTVAWGAFTATDDLLGVIQQTCEKRPTLMQLQEILPRWIGEISQVPPVYCAAKIQGMPAYTRARQGEDVCLAARRVHIHHMEILDHRGDESDFRMTCGTGTYVRSVARDMATVLGMCGFIKALRRVRVGPFHEGMCLGQLEQSNPDEIRGILLPPQQVLGGMQSYQVSQSEKMALWDGKKIQLSLLTPLTQNVIACYDESGCLVALANVCQGWLAPTRCFIGTI
jgi:tRNA pseudouridine55 synthase